MTGPKKKGGEKPRKRSFVTRTKNTGCGGGGDGNGGGDGSGEGAEVAVCEAGSGVCEAGSGVCEAGSGVCEGGDGGVEVLTTRTCWFDSGRGGSVGVGESRVAAAVVTARVAAVVAVEVAVWRQRGWQCR